METHSQAEREPRTGFGGDRSESGDSATNGKRVHFSEGSGGDGGSNTQTAAEQAHHDVLSRSQ